MDLLQELRADHWQARDLLTELREGSARSRSSTLKKLAKAYRKTATAIAEIPPNAPGGGGGLMRWLEGRPDPTPNSP